MKSMNVLVLVHCEDYVVDVRNESLKSRGVAFVGRPCFGVNRRVVAKFAISSSCIVRLPIV